MNMNVLAVGCHPDDLEIGCGGTIARYARENHKVFMCIAANGNAGHKIIEPGELAAIRLKEAEASAKVLGAELLTIGAGDLLVNNYDEETVDKMIDVIRYAKPDVIITHNPQDYMRDHVQTSELVFNASFGASITHRKTAYAVFDAIPPMYYMDTLAGMGFIPTEYVDISGVLEQKLDALACHGSQILWMKDHDKIDFLDFVRTCAKYRGLQCGAAAAEGFRPCVNWPRMAAKRLLP
jgi:LmbE family N-acetylglucosaminyl deacetylase